MLGRDRQARLRLVGLAAKGPFCLEEKPGGFECWAGSAGLEAYPAGTCLHGRVGHESYWKSEP